MGGLEILGVRHLQGMCKAGIVKIDKGIFTTEWHWTIFILCYQMSKIIEI